MFRLLSKESNIFSIPLYIGFLLLMVIAFNVMNISKIDIVSVAVTFVGIALGYFLFNKINLNYQTHLPLFLYTFFIFAFYPGQLDIGIAVALLTNSFLLLIFTSPDDYVRKNSYMLVGIILAVNYIMLPTTWPMAIFVIFHILGTSSRIGLNFIRLIFGFGLIILSYLSVMYFIGYTTFNPAYFPFYDFKPMKDFYPYVLLLPIAVMIILAVAAHFMNYSRKSLMSRYKYTFLLVFSLAQLTTIVLYMGKNYEYLLLLAFPSSIILSRYLMFLPKYWMRELGLWIIIGSLVIFKLGTYFDMGEVIFE